jgi:hypothetical protein
MISAENRLIVLALNHAVQTYLLGCLESLCDGKSVKVKFSLEQATKAQRGSRGIALLFL